jgi:hypothetical protein
MACEVDSVIVAIDRTHRHLLCLPHLLHDGGREKATKHALHAVFTSVDAITAHGKTRIVAINKARRIRRPRTNASRIRGCDILNARVECDTSLPNCAKFHRRDVRSCERRRGIRDSRSGARRASNPIYLPWSCRVTAFGDGRAPSAGLTSVFCVTLWNALGWMIGAQTAVVAASIKALVL